MSDEIDYDQLGSTIVRTGTYSLDGTPTAYRAVGYPALVATTYWIGGSHPTAVKIVQAICDSGTALLLFLTLSRRSRSAALAAGLSWAVFPAAVLFASQMFPESMFVFGLALFAYGLDRTYTTGKGPLWILGLLLGCLVLVKPTMILFAAFLVVALPRARPDPLRLRLLAWACLPIALWVVRDAVVMHAPVLTTSAGTNLLIGNNPNATGGYSAVEMSGAHTHENEVENDARAMHAAVEYVRRNPGRTLVNGIKKIGFLMSSEGELAVGQFSRNAADFSIRFQDKFRALPAWIHLIVSLPTALVMIVGTVGLATRTPDTFGRLFWALLTATLVTSVVFFGGSRFRFPLMIFMTAFAGEFMVDVHGRLRRLRGKRLGAVGFTISAFALAWIVELWLVYRT
jgi:4-amino-4-deoxy-L-arabinose transferase-like glycosyltransferase